MASKPAKKGKISRGRIPSIGLIREITNKSHPLHIPKAEICDAANIPDMTLNDAVSGKTRRPSWEVVSRACAAIWLILDEREAALKELKK